MVDSSDGLVSWGEIDSFVGVTFAVEEKEADFVEAEKIGAAEEKTGAG